MSFNTGLSDFAARLRRFIVGGPAGPDEFQRLALELFGLQFLHNGPYRRFCESRGSKPGNVAHWTDIPALPTAAFKELEISSLPDSERMTEFHSSGTTEQRPSRHFHSTESLAVYEVSLWQWFADHAPEPADYDLALLTPPPAQAPHSSLVHMFDVIRRRLKFADSAYLGTAAADGGWTLDSDAAMKFLRSAEGAKRPAGILGTAISYAQLADVLAERGGCFELAPGSWALETGGYKGRSRELPKPELHALIAQLLCIASSRILCEYGMSELSSQAYDTTVGALDEPHRGNPHPGPLPLGTGEGELSAARGAVHVTNHLRTIRDANEGAEEQRRIFRFPPWARARIVSPENSTEVAEGETGLLRVFDLANVFSVMGIETGDLAVRRGEGFELIGRAPAAEPRGCSLMLAAPG